MAYIRTTFKDFVAFIRSRGVVGFAVGFILGKAVSDLVGSFVNDILNPIIGLALSRFSELSDAAVHIGGSSIAYGKFLSLVINFILLALVVYVGAKVLRLEKLDKKD